MIFVGDALFRAETTSGQASRGSLDPRPRPQRDKRVIEAIVACLGGVESASPGRDERVPDAAPGILMEPEPGNPLGNRGRAESSGRRGPDGELYLFPRWLQRAIIPASALRA